MKVAIYCRLSDEDKFKTNEDSESIQNQKSLLKSYAKERGWEIYDIYCDENYSGIDGNRPEYKRLLGDAENGCFDIILCKTQSRFSRNMEDVEKYLNGMLQQWNVRFVSLLDNMDTADRTNKKSRQINGLINEWYLEDLSENIKAVLCSKHKEGKSTRAFLPYGLKKNENNRNAIEIDEDSAKNVRLIFDCFLGGMKVSEIAVLLNERGILSPQEYKLSKGEKLFLPKRSKSGLWTVQAVLRILKNPMYKGDMVHNIYTKPSYKYKKVIKNKAEDYTVIKNTHPPIVSNETFLTAQTMLLKKGQKIKLVCGECGGVMCTRKKCYKDREYLYIYCKGCEKKINGNFLKKYFDEKYAEKIDFIEVHNDYGACIFFKN